MNTKSLCLKLALSLLVVIQTASGALNLEITGGQNAGRKIAIIPFSGQQLPADITGIIRNDLAYSGAFSPVVINNLNIDPTTPEKINPAMFPQGVEAVVVGNVVQDAASKDKYNVRFYLIKLDGGRAQVLYGLNSIVPQKLARRYAHTVSNHVYQKLTGIEGAFNTRIAYIKTKHKTKYPYELTVADYDGHNEVRLIVSSQPIMSPSWSPDGKKLAYVSFENRKAEIFIIDLVTRKRTKVSSYKGLNSNPKWSPDGTKLAFVLSKDGNPEIYMLDLFTKKLVRVTNNRAIDTEPSWSHDSKKIYFVSERTGRAQIYQITLANGKLEKVTHQPVKNLSPAALPDGNGIVMINQNQGFKVARLDEQGHFNVLTNSTLDESPSVSPNGAMIIYSTIHAGKKVLGLVSSDGRFKAYIPNATGEISSPAWSPYLK
jgi:TolB protein